MREEVVSDWDMRDYYPQHMLETTTLTQISYRTSKCPKTAYNFIEVEIKSDSRLDILVEFTFPYSNEFNLYLITNKNKDLLIARDELGVFIYRMVKQGKGP